MPAAPPDQVEAIVARLKALRAARAKLDEDEKATVIAGRLKGVTWKAMATALGTRAPWLCEYYKPELPEVTLTVKDGAAAAKAPAGAPSRGRRRRRRT